MGDSELSKFSLAFEHQSEDAVKDIAQRIRRAVRARKRIGEAREKAARLIRQRKAGRS